MTKVDGTKLLEHLRAKWASKPCPMCGAGPWNVQDSAFQLTEFSQGGLVIGGPVIPVVPVVCGNCGNTVLVNALVARVINEPPQQPAAPPKQEGSK